MEECSRRLDRVEEASRTAVRLLGAERSNRDRRRCYLDREVRRSKRDRVCWGRSAAANRWLAAVEVAACRSNQVAAVEASPMSWMSFRSASPNRGRDRCCRERDWARARRSRDQVCSEHFPANRLSVAVAHLFRWDRVGALPMLRTESRSVA